MSVRLTDQASLAFIDSAATWATEKLATAARLPAATKRAAAALSRAGHTVHPVLGLEMHHDGTGRTDFFFVTDEPATRELRIGPFTFTAVAQDAIEFDLEERDEALAGIFHRVGEITMPAALRHLGRPMLISQMPARAGFLRLIFPIADARTLEQLRRSLQTTEVTPAGVAALEAASTLIDGPRALRVGLDVDPTTGRLGPRLGLEVVRDPRREPVTQTLRALGVVEEVRDRLLALAHTLPMQGRYRPTVPGLPALQLDERAMVAAPLHFSVSWRDEIPVVKSYLELHSEPLNRSD